MPTNPFAPPFIPIADLAVVTPGNFDHVVVEQNGVARKALMPDIVTAANVLSAAIDTVIADAQADAAPLINGLGYMVPVPYASGISITSTRQTVEYAGEAYAPIASQVPFTTSGTFETAKFRLIQGITASDLASTASGKGASLVQADGGNVRERLERFVRIEGDANFRDFWRALAVFNQSEDGNVTIASYGDSVSADLAMAFADYWGRQIGFVNYSTFTPVEFANALVTPTGQEPQQRWPGVSLAYFVSGGATYIKNTDGPTPNPTYVPNSDERWSIPSGGTVTFGTGLLAGFRTMIAFLAIEPGAGQCTVDVLDDTNAVISTQSFNCANATLGATKAEFTGLDTSKRYKLRITGTSGTVTALGAVFMFRRGVTLLSWRWGGSTFNQQAQSSKVIFDYINNALNTSIVFVETKGETTLDGIPGGIDGLDLTVTRLNALNATKVLIGSRPDSGTEAAQYDQIYRYRSRAATQGYVYVDGYNSLKDYAELQRLGWDKRNNVTEAVHLPVVTAYYVAGLLIARMPVGFIKSLWMTRKVFSPKVCASGFSLIDSQYQNDETRAFEFAKNYGLNVPLAELYNLARVKIKNPYSSAIATLEMYGGELNTDSTMRALGFNQNGSAPNTFGGPVIMNGQMRSGQTSAGSTLGTVVKRQPIYDAAGTLLGYIPIYNTIT